MTEIIHLAILLCVVVDVVFTFVALILVTINLIK